MGFQMSSPLVLTYFPIRGRSEAIRLALEFGGAEYVNKNLSMDEWADMKEGMPFGQLPLLEDGTVRIAQSGAILRYVGRKYDLYGASRAQAAHIDCIIEGTQDFHQAAGKIFMSARFKKGDRSDLIDLVEHWLEIFAKILAERKHFVGDSVTIADIAVFNYLENWMRAIDQRTFQAHTNLDEFHDRMKKEERIAAYLASDRRPAITPPPFMGILCTPEE